MKIEEAIAHGKAVASSAKAVQRKKQTDRALTRGGVIRVFNAACEEAGYSQPILTREVHNMVNGFVTVFRKNNVPAKDVYSFIQTAISEFKSVAGTKSQTSNGKPWTLGQEPHVKDILFCRDSLWAKFGKKSTEITFPSPNELDRSLSNEEIINELNKDTWDD